jgi:hypothetical protein
MSSIRQSGCLVEPHPLRLGAVDTRESDTFALSELLPEYEFDQDVSGQGSPPPRNLPTGQRDLTAPMGSRPGIGPRLSVALSPDTHPVLGRDVPKRALTAPARAAGSPAGPSDVTVPVAKQR